LAILGKIGGDRPGEDCSAGGVATSDVLPMSHEQDRLLVALVDLFALAIDLGTRRETQRDEHPLVAPIPAGASGSASNGAKKKGRQG
jgi:hypothetical protein